MTKEKRIKKEYFSIAKEKCPFTNEDLQNGYYEGFFDCATMMNKDIDEANEIIKYLLEFTYCLSPYKSDYKELKERAEKFLEKYKNITNNYEED